MRKSFFINEANKLIELGIKFSRQAHGIKWLQVNSPDKYLEEVADIADKYNLWNDKVRELIDSCEIDSLYSSVFYEPDEIYNYTGAQSLDQFIGGSSVEEQKERLKEIVRLIKYKSDKIRELIEKFDKIKKVDALIEIFVSDDNGIFRYLSDKKLNCRLHGKKRIQILNSIIIKKMSGPDISKLIYGESKPEFIQRISKAIKGINKLFKEDLKFNNSEDNNLIIRSSVGGFRINSEKYKIVKV